MEEVFRPFGVALFGVGRIGEVHLKNILAHPGIELRWIVEADLKRARDMIKRHNLSNNVNVAAMDEQNKALQDPQWVNAIAKTLLCKQCVCIH